MKLNLKREPRYPPREPRVATFITTAALLPDDREIVVQVRNMSAEGFMACANERLKPATRFGLSVPGRGIFRAEIRWSDDREFGARFESPLEFLQVDSD